MKIHTAAILLTLLVAPTVQAAGEKDNLEKKATAIIDLRCTRCHTDAQINAAATVGKDMNAIVRQMEERGATLTESEKEVLGIYWKEKKWTK